MSHDLQLRRRLPAGHPHHPGDPRGLVGDRGATRLSGGAKRRDPAWESLWQAVGAGPSGEPEEPEGVEERAPESAAERAPDAGAERAADIAPERDPTRRAHPARFIVRTDGAARGNPGPASLGAVLIDAARPDARRPDAPPYASISEYLGVQTNNVAEYTGLVRALTLARELGAREVELLLDSMLIVEQINGRWRVKDAKLAPLHARARQLLAGFDRWTASHVRRAQNHAADALCNEAIDRALAGGPALVVSRPD